MHEPDLEQLTASDLVRLYRQRQLSPVEVMDGYLARIDRLNGALNAFVLIDPDAARAEARQAEKAFTDAADPSLLTGLPVSVKDNIMTAGLRSTSGSPLFADHVPEADAGVVAAVRRAGGIVVGKTNTPAFGWTGTTDNKLFGATPNPYDRSVTAGGSSGGAAVSAAAALAPVNIGTDGGGSLRTPAAFTGTVGFKPSHGRLPDVPAHPHWLMQHYGPIARTVADAALVLQAAAGPHPADPHSLPRSTDDYVAATAAAPRDLKVLFTTQLGFVDALDPEIETLCREAAGALAELGWTVAERDLDWPDPAPFANTLSAVGFAWRLRDHRHRRDDIEDGILAILDYADALPPNAFYDAYLERNRWCAHPLALFDEFDLLITPATAAPPFPLGQLAPAAIAGKPVPPSAWSPYLRPFNLTGQPAISVPAGRTRAGLPVGLQIVGPRFGDAQVLAAAAAFERLRPWPMWREAAV